MEAKEDEEEEIDDDWDYVDWIVHSIYRLFSSLKVYPHHCWWIGQHGKAEDYSNHADNK